MPHELDETKYFLEHKDLHTWLTIHGDLANDPSKLSLICYDKKEYAENWLSPIKEKWDSDYFGNYHFRDEGQDFLIGLQEMVSKKLKEKGIDLFTDFIITEHLSA